VVEELTFPYYHFLHGASASCRGTYQSRRASHVGCRAISVARNREKICVHKSAFIPSEENVSWLQVKMQNALIVLQRRSLMPHSLGKREMYQKSKPSCNATKNTEQLLGTKHMHSCPRMVLIVELSTERRLFVWRGTLHGTESPNPSGARMYIRGRLVFMRIVTMGGRMWRVRRTAESCVDVIIKRAPLSPLHQDAVGPSLELPK